MKKSTLFLSVGALLAVVALVTLLALPKQAEMTSAAVARLVPIYQVQESQQKVALTIDAAWGADKTPEILEILAEYDIKATFFLVGRWVREFPENTTAIYKAGHAIGSHSDTHADFTAISDAAILDELQGLESALDELGIPRPTLFRAPYGAYDDRVMKALNGQGYQVIQWTIDTLDWQESRTAEQVIAAVTEKICPGSIILCHNQAETITEYLPVVIEELLSRGYEFVLVSDMLQDGWTTDNNGLLQPAT